MMNISQDSIPDNSKYQIRKFTKIKIFIGALTLLPLGFILNFPADKFITDLLKNNIPTSRNCDIDFNKIVIDLPFPRLKLNNLTVPESCFNTNSIALNIKNIYFTFWGPSFFPPGIRFKVTAEQKSSKLVSYVSVSPFKQVIKLPETNLTKNFFKDFTGKRSPISGDISVQGLFEIKKNLIDTASLTLYSKNLIAESLNIMGLSIPKMDISNLQIETTLSESKNLKLKKFQIGNERSPFKLELDGTVKLNQKRIDSSNLNLSGKVKFSESFLDNFSIIKLFIANKKSENGVYAFKLSGNARSAKPKFL